MSELPQRCAIVVEVPRGSFIKRELHLDRVEFISPVPCPFNYGYVPGTIGDDGDPPDALELGPRLKLGQTVERPVVGVVRFLDGGERDDKLLLSERSPSRRQRALLRGFFSVYAVARRQLNRVQGISGETRFEGIEIP